MKTKKTCPNCKTIFECEESTYCWCMDILKIHKEELDDQDCLCKKCLQEKYKERIFKVKKID